MFYVGPWHRHTDGGRSYFGPPPGCRALLDLSAAHAPGSRGLFAGGPLGLDYERVPGHRLVRLAWEALTVGAAPDGLGAPRPLVPTTAGRLELHLGPAGRVRCERFRYGQHGHTNRLRDQLRGQFRDRWDANPALARKCLDFECHKYGLVGRGDWRELVPRDLRPHVPGRLAHETTITDNFNRADQSGLGSSSEGWSWTDVLDTFQIASNLARTPFYAANRFARAEIDLSSADHYAQIAIVGLGNWRTCARFAGAADTSYWGGSGGGYNPLNKRITGTDTELGHGSTGSADQTIKTEANGSTITLYMSGAVEVSATDTAITGNTRTGIGALNADKEADDFVAADLAAGDALFAQSIF